MLKKKTKQKYIDRVNLAIEEAYLDVPVEAHPSDMEYTDYGCSQTR
jgi:hypothetical protein